MKSWADLLGITARDTQERMAYDVLKAAMPMTEFNKFAKGRPVSKLYEIREVVNGYIAVFPNEDIVLGKTLAEVASEANAHATELKTGEGLGEQTGTNADGHGGSWRKGLIDNLVSEFYMDNAIIKLFKGEPPALDSEVSDNGYAQMPAGV